MVLATPSGTALRDIDVRALSLRKALPGVPGLAPLVVDWPAFPDQGDIENLLVKALASLAFGHFYLHGLYHGQLVALLMVRRIPRFRPNKRQKNHYLFV